MKKRIWSKAVSIFTAILLVVGIVPNTTTTVLAADGDTVYVGGVALTCSESTPVYATTNESGEVKIEGADENNYNIKWDGSTLTLDGAKIKGGTSSESLYATVGIYAFSNSGDVSLNIALKGVNEIFESSNGIWVYSSSANAGAVTLTIEGEGSLNASGSSSGILVQSNNGDATLTIQNADVTAENSSSSGDDVTVRAGSSSSASLSVDGGSLTATGKNENGAGIRYTFGSSSSGSGTPTVTVSGNAVVDAKNGGIANNSSSPIQYKTGSESTGGIVFDGNTGTVYGNVTLQDDLTIGEGESLTIPNGSALNGNGKLTNNGTIIVEKGGNLTGNPGGIIVTAPIITTDSLPNGTVGESYTATLEATGNNITWSASDLPAGLTLDADTGAITGTPTTDGQFQVTVTATNSVDSASKDYTLNIKPATVSVTGLKLDKESLTLQEKGSATLTVTVKPADATNQDVTWKSSDTSIATVSEDGTVTAINAGTATITATAADGSGISASCNLTVTHGNMIQTPKKDATCTVDGTEEYWTCEICGKHYKDESGTISTTPEENKIPATGHNYGEPEWNWSEDGKTCTVTFTCAKDENHKETPEVKVASEVKTPATCTETGVTTYTATVEFNGKTYTDTKDVADIPAIGHKLTKTEAKAPTSTDTGNIEYWYCKVCDKYFSDEKAEHEITLEDTIIAKLPKLISGANQEWTKGSKEGLTFKIDTDIKEFKKVLVDGKELKDTDYHIKSGSTILTLKPSFLDTLSAGKHKIRFEFNTGSVEAYFTVKDKENSSQTESANTGVQNKYGLWIVLLLVAAGGLAGFGILSKRRKNHK